MHDMHNNEAGSELVREMLKEKRSDRRWKNFRFICWFALFAYILIAIVGHFGKPSTSDAAGKGKYAALVRLDGMIAPGRGFSAEEIIPVLKDAFSDRHSEGVIIDINSPGGN